MSPFPDNETQQPYLVVLGTAQDGGYPHPGCRGECCRRFYDGKEDRHLVSCLGLLDPLSGRRWLFDCTPDFPAQLHFMDNIFPAEGELLDGIFLTHAHIGHYAGLMYLGREAMGTRQVPVYGTADMAAFLRDNAPWSQLVTLGNIDLRTVEPGAQMKLSEHITVAAMGVPHRAEYTRVVGYQIRTADKSVIYIPDIDKWHRWDMDIVTMVRDNDLLFLDGTFFRDGEISGRPIDEIPHPFIEESLAALAPLPAEEKAKVHFIHMNHTNPAMFHGSDAQREIAAMGFNVAIEGQRHGL
jgi:pyrroloquinoline quinone biosynthesis protein B